MREELELERSNLDPYDFDLEFLSYIESQPLKDFMSLERIKTDDWDVKRGF